MCIDPDLPFDHARGVIHCKDVSTGRVCDLPLNLYKFRSSPMYCTGWIKRGPIGVILDTALDARQTAKSVLDDLEKIESFDLDLVEKPGSILIKQILTDKSTD